MTQYEYKVVPAPRRGLKGRGVKGPEERFANALAHAMNDAAADGWEYFRADTLPSEERQGLTGRTTEFRNVLVFRRALPFKTSEDFQPAKETAPARPEPAPAPAPVLPSEAGAEDGAPPIALIDEDNMGQAPRLGPAGELSDPEADITIEKQ